MNRKYRKTVIAGNWKMNMLASEIKPFMEALRAAMPAPRTCDVVLCTPAVMIPAMVKAALSGIDATQLRRCIIAYEPIWAIGTGKTATAEQAQEVCEGIRAVIRGIYGARPARAVSILYGGSMNAKNAAELLAQPDIDGGLIGGASLKPADFATIIAATNQE